MTVDGTRRRLARVAEMLHAKTGRPSSFRNTSSTSTSTSKSDCSSNSASKARQPDPSRGSAWASRDRELFEHLPDNGQSALAALHGLPSPFDEPDPPVTLTDEQLWSWCSTGVHVIDPAELMLPQALHHLLYAKLKFALHEEYQPGKPLLICRNCRFASL